MQRNWNNYTILKKKNKTGGLTPADFRTHHKGSVIKTMVLEERETHRSTEQSRVEEQIHTCTDNSFSTKLPG